MAIAPQTCYFKFLIKINRNNTGANRACDKNRFVAIFNEAKNRWVDENLRTKGSIHLDVIQELIETETLLNPIISQEYCDFAFGDEFYEFIDAECLAQKDKCRQTIRLREIKNQSKQMFIFDDAQKPSFDFEWSFLTVQNNLLRIYKTDFDILSVTVEYYKFIPNIDISGYINEFNQPSTDIPIDLFEVYVDQIINRAAEEFMRNYENPTGLQIAKDRTNSES